MPTPQTVMLDHPVPQQARISISDAVRHPWFCFYMVINPRRRCAPAPGWPCLLAVAWQRIRPHSSLPINPRARSAFFRCCVHRFWSPILPISINYHKFHPFAFADRSSLFWIRCSNEQAMNDIYTWFFIDQNRNWIQYSSAFPLARLWNCITSYKAAQFQFVVQQNHLLIRWAAAFTTIIWKRLYEHKYRKLPNHESAHQPMSMINSWWFHLLLFFLVNSHLPCFVRS